MTETPSRISTTTDGARIFCLTSHRPRRRTNSTAHHCSITRGSAPSPLVLKGRGAWGEGLGDVALAVHPPHPQPLSPGIPGEREEKGAPTNTKKIHNNRSKRIKAPIT